MSESVINFIKQIVREKHGDQMEVDSLEQEVNKTYGEFENKLVFHFKSMISDQQKAEYDKLVDQSVDQKVLLAFLMDSIENFEQKIVLFLIDFKKNYLKDSVSK